MSRILRFSTRRRQLALSSYLQEIDPSGVKPNFATALLARQLTQLQGDGRIASGYLVT
jgi:hypothetical protein